MLSKCIGAVAARIGPKDRGEYLRHAGVELRSFRMLDCLAYLPAFFPASVEGSSDLLAGIVQTQRFTRYGRMGTGVDEDVVVRVPSVGRGDDDGNFFTLQLRDPFSKADRTFSTDQVDTPADGIQVVQVVGIGMMKLFFEAGHRRPAGQLGGHDGRADLVALVIEGDVVDPVMPAGLAAGTAGLRGDIVAAEDGIVLREVAEMVMPVDTTQDTVHRFGDGRVVAGGDLSDVVGGGDRGPLPAFGRQQLELFFDGFSGGFGEPGADPVGVHPAAIGLDEG